MRLDLGDVVLEVSEAHLRKDTLVGRGLYECRDQEALD